jgi:transposase-like protein
MKRLPASERTRKEIQELLSGKMEGGVTTSDFIRSATRLLIEEALEAEVRDVLGRGYYEAGAEAGSGYRNGQRRGRLKTAEGLVEYAVPQVSDRDEPFQSRLRGLLSKRSEELVDKAIEMYARGLSTRDIEEVFRGEDGQSLLTRTAVSEVTERLWEEYQEFASRDLSEYEMAYLFSDGIAERLHMGQKREAVLAAWGFTTGGERVLINVAPGTKEDTASCRDFYRDLKNRGLNDPTLGVTDGAPGLMRAFEEAFPRSLRQRCLAHKMRNLLGKVPEDAWPEIKAQATACYQAASPALALILRDEFVKAHEKSYPTLVACFLDDFDACIAHLKLPVNHRRATRTTNLLERLFGEERRRTKVIPHAFGEKAVLKLMYAALIRASEKWKSIRITEFERRQLNQLKKEIDEGFEEKLRPATRPTPLKVSSKNRT